MSKVVSSNVSKRDLITCTKVDARVVLDDGRIGKGTSGEMFISGNEQDAISAAIIDANSKPLPKK